MLASISKETFLLSSLTVYEAHLILVDPLLLMYFFSREKMKPRTSLARRRFIGHSSHSSNIKSFYSGKQAVAKKNPPSILRLFAFCFCCCYCSSGGSYRRDDNYGAAFCGKWSNLSILMLDRFCSRACCASSTGSSFLSIFLQWTDHSMPGLHFGFWRPRASCN